MYFQAIQDFTQKELDQFKTVCNLLLSRTFVVRDIAETGKGHRINPDYVFLSAHYEAVRDYLSLLDWDLIKDDYNGYFYVFNKDSANRLTLNKIQTAVLLGLRLLYDENQERLGLCRDAVCTVRDVLDKVVTDYPILPVNPNMEEVHRAMTIFENHSVVQRLEGRFRQPECKFSILPTILTVVSSEKLNDTVARLRKDEQDEEADEDTAD